MKKKIYEISKGATLKYPPGERIRPVKASAVSKGLYNHLCSWYAGRVRPQAAALWDWHHRAPEAVSVAKCYHMPTVSLGNAALFLMLNKSAVIFTLNTKSSKG